MSSGPARLDGGCTRFLETRRGFVKREIPAMPIPEQPGSRQPANPTAAHVVSLTDFDQVKSSFLNWHGRIEQLSSGRFNGALRVVRGSVVRLMAIEGNQQVSLQGRDAADMFSIYPVVTGNADSLWQGRRLQPGQFVLSWIQRGS